VKLTNSQALDAAKSCDFTNTNRATELSMNSDFVFSERSRSLFAVARPSVVCLSVTFVRPTQAVQIFGSISTALGTLATH